jgi:hypothetical protein
MASFNWSMSMIGYPAHKRSGSPVVGVSHMSTHEVLRFAEILQLTTGWLRAEGSQPQLERVRGGDTAWVALAELFADRRVVMTDGLASGSLIYVAATAKHGVPPADRTLTAWAVEHGLPWVEVIDNEIAYFGGLGNPHVDRLLTWFLCQRPIEGDWRKTRLAAPVAGRLRHGLFDHGWTRNLECAKPGKKPSVDLWGGVHGACMLEHAALPAPSRVNVGLRLALAGEEWSASELGGRCPLTDDNGKLAR